jgi:uncharacterized protein YbbK (DUF523 family)
LESSPAVQTNTTLGQVLRQIHRKNLSGLLNRLPAGAGKIYDGSFTCRLGNGNGVFAEACKQAGMEFRTEEEI